MAHSVSFRSLFFALAASLAFAPCAWSQSAAGSIPIAKDRIVHPIVESDVATLAGNTHPLARPEYDRGLVADETRLERMVLVLQPSTSQQKALDALVEAQQEPASGMYHAWLSPEEYGSHFGVSSGDLARITAWLTAHGFTVEPVPAGRRLVLFSGTAAQVAETFHTEIHSYDVDGAMHIANSEDPQIPRALAPVVAGVLSLHDFRRTSATRSVRAVASPENTQGSTHYLLPADSATIYDLNPQYAAGHNGSGVSIAIVGRSNINLSDVNSFRSYAGLSANTPTVILEGVNPGLVSDDQDESTLDVEWSGGMAPGAAVKFVAAASTSTSDGVDLSAQYIVNHLTAPIMSTSYGSCEAYMGSSELSFYNSLWEQAASEGISSFVSSGDSGAAGCNGGSSSSGSMAGVNGLCSSPYSTCVGGTEFNEGSSSSKYWSSSNGSGGGSAVSYIPEKVWNESASDGGSGLWASTGGISLAYTQPAWQKGVPGATRNGMRAVPDVALTAASHDGYLICEDGSWYVIAGTSAASPSFAGIMSIVDEKQGGVGQGSANPTLYSLIDASENPFHPTPSGNNSVPGVTGFTASGAVFNLATGLGSVDASVLVNVWPSAGTPLPQKGITITPSLSSISILPGNTATVTIAVAGTGGYSGTVTLKATAPSGETVALSTASIKTGASMTLTLSAAATVAAGSGTISISGVSGTYTATASVPVTIEAPVLTLKPASSSVRILQGETATFTVAVSATSGYTQPVTLKATAPSGVTVTFNPASVKSGSSTTATVSATTSAAAGAGSIAITGTSNAFTGTVSEAVTVVAPSLVVTPRSSSVSVFQGQTTTFTVAVSAASGFTQAVTLRATAPSGVTVSFNPASVTPGGTSTATVSASNTAAAGAGSIAITASSGTFTGSSSESVTVKAPSLAVTPKSSSVSVFPGQTATFPVAVSAASGFTQPVTLRATAPSGVTVSFNPASVTSGATATATVSAATTATPGTESIAITGASSVFTASASEPVTVEAPALVITPGSASLSIVQGKTATFTVAVSAASGYTLPVALKATAPSGVTVSFNPASVKPGTGSTVTVSVNLAAVVGTSNITITGTSGAASATATKSLAITASASLTASAAAAKVFVVQGNIATLRVTATTGGSFSGPVALAINGLPAGVSASWVPTYLSGSGAGTSAFLVTLKANGNAPLAAATLQISASGDGITALTTTALQVVGAATGL